MAFLSRGRRRTGWLVGGAALLWSMVAPGAGAESREAAAALVPYAMWVGRLPADDAATWTERKLLASYRGRLGAWLEADMQARALRQTPAPHAELCLVLARAAREREDWSRANAWWEAAGVSLEKIPEADRAAELLASYYAEAFALRTITDVRVPYGALQPLLEGDRSRRESFTLLRGLVDLAIVAGDQEGYTRLATSLLNTVILWNRETAPDAPRPSEPDQLFSVYLDSLLARGYAGTAAQLAGTGLADPDAREAILAAARTAERARSDDATLRAFLAPIATPRERHAVVLGEPPSEPGLVVGLARAGRNEFVFQLLAQERDHVFPVAAGADRAHLQHAWPAAVLRVAEEYRRAGDATAATQLADLFTDARLPEEDAAGSAATRIIELHEGLVAFATELGVHAELDTARRLLETLPVDYPAPEDEHDGPEQYRAMRQDAAATVLRQKRVALAQAWAVAGEDGRARDVLDLLPTDERPGSAHWALVRQRVIASLATAAALRGETERAKRLTDEARDEHLVFDETSAHEALALLPAYILTGRHEEAWDEFADLTGAEPSTVITAVLAALVNLDRANRALEWMGQAPAVHRRALWRAFFATTMPEPAVLPVRTP